MTSGLELAAYASKEAVEKLSKQWHKVVKVFVDAGVFSPQVKNVHPFSLSMLRLVGSGILCYHLSNAVRTKAFTNKDRAIVDCSKGIPNKGILLPHALGPAPVIAEPWVFDDMFSDM